MKTILPTRLLVHCQSLRPLRRAIVLAPWLLAACGGDSPKKVVGPPSCSVTAVPGIAAARVPDASPYDAIFTAAGAEFDVPPSILRAIGYVETRWQMVEGHEEFHGLPAAHGVMALRGDRLRTAARLTELDEATVRVDPTANIRAAAALLRAHADSLGITSHNPEAWAPAIEQFSGIEIPEGRASYAAEVQAVIEGRRSTPALASTQAALTSACTPPAPPPPPVTDYATATWRQSNNFNSRMAGDGGRIHFVIIHSCEGSYAGCWSWLMNPASNVSAHYVVREDGAEITQLVRESSRAWHIAAIYDSTLNGNHDGGLHGVQSNHFTVGIEHAGFASQTGWPEAQIEASARLVCDMARRWQIPRDRLHIVSHGQLQPYNRTDPGAGWPWDDYMARIDRNCAA